MRKTIITGMSIVVLLMIGTIYYFFFGGDKLIQEKQDTPANQSQKPADRPDEKKIDLTKKVVQVVTKKVYNPVFAYTEGYIWYFDQAGQLYRIKIDGSEEKNFGLTDLKISAKVLWPQTGNDFIQQVLDNAGRVYFRLYSSAKQEFVNLKYNIKAMDWMPDGKRIVYVWSRDDGGYELKISNSDGTGFAKISDLSAMYNPVVSPKGDMALVIKSFSGQNENLVFKVDIASGNAEKLLDRGKNIDVLFSPDGSKLAFVRIDEQTDLPHLWLYNFLSKDVIDLKYIVPIEKVAWSKDSKKLYIALPEKVSPGQYSGGEASIDKLLAYDTSAGKESIIASKTELGSKDLRGLMVDNKEEYLFFQSKSDGTLYRVKIK